MRAWAAHGGYRLGLGRARILDLSSAPIASLSPVDLGFQAIRDLGEAAEDLDYAFLTRAWRECLDARSPPARPSLDVRVASTA